MKYLTILSFVLLWSCSSKKETVVIPDYSAIEITKIVTDDSISVRALELSKDGFVFSGNRNLFGSYDAKSDQADYARFKLPTEKNHEFRGVASTSRGIYAVAAARPGVVINLPALNGTPKQVYFEDTEGVFYDAMRFWNDQEGIALGDAMNGCMSIIITRDGGQSWQKLSCDILPKSDGEEGAFAASNGNIEVNGDQVWCATGKRILYSPDKGKTWTSLSTPIIQGEGPQGMYAIDFYDDQRGVAIGGDYTKPDSNKDNLIATNDGGKTWTVLSDETSPGYRSSIQYIPGTDAKGMLAVGFKGIDLSLDGGLTWKHLSDESYYTVRFADNKSGYLAGRGQIAKFSLK